MRVAHQLRAPVAAIQSCLDVVLQGYLDHSPEQQRQLLQSARDSAAEMLTLTSDVLRLGELRDATLAEPQELVDVGEVAAHVIEAWRAEALARSIQLTVEIEPDLPLVRGTKAHLEEAFRNLVDNAIKHAPLDGHVTVDVRAEGAFGEVTVADDGPGIPPEHLPRLFDRFYRVDDARSRDAGGSGLGLAIVRELIEVQGGRVWVRSGNRGGAVFGFALPLA
jgi:two-component system phosphate regulon sensor histidine kinase PhoR